MTKICNFAIQTKKDPICGRAFSLSINKFVCCTKLKIDLEVNKKLNDRRQNNQSSFRLHQAGCVKSNILTMYHTVVRYLSMVSNEVEIITSRNLYLPLKWSLGFFHKECGLCTPFFSYGYEKA